MTATTRSPLMSFVPAQPSAVSVEVQWIGATHLMRRLPPHEHLFYELLLFTEGAGTLVVAGDEVPVHARTVVALPPSAPHDARRIGAAGGWSIIFLADAVTPETVHPFGSSVLEMLQPSALDEAAFADALGFIATMNEELRARRPGYDVMVRSALQMLAITLMRCRPRLGRPASTGERKDLAFMRAVFEDIDRHYARGGSLRAAARRLDVQPGHLTTKVRRLTGRTYGAWRIERRMTEARRLLSSTDLSVAVIAERLGYTEDESFVRRFRTHHAVSPALWRLRARSAAEPGAP